LVGPPDRDNLRISMTLMRLGTCTIPLLMLGLAFIWQARRPGFAPDRIAFGLAALLFDIENASNPGFVYNSIQSPE
jgi:hypothetical protein